MQWTKVAVALRHISFTKRFNNTSLARRLCTLVTCSGASQLLRPPDAKVKGQPQCTSPSRDPLCAVQNAADSGLFSDDEQSPRPTVRVAGPIDSPFASAARDVAAATQDSSSSSNSSSDSDCGTSSSSSGSQSETERFPHDGDPPYAAITSPQNPSSAQLGQTIRPDHTAALAIPFDRPLPVSSPEELLSPHQRQRRLVRERSLQMRQPPQLLDSPSPLSPVEGQPRALRGQPLKSVNSPQPHPRLLPKRSSALEHAMSRPLLDPSLAACASTPRCNICSDTCVPLVHCCLTSRTSMSRK